MFLLDTNTVSALMHEPNGIVQRRAMSAARPVVTSIIVAAEVRFGLERRPSQRLERQVRLVLDQMTILAFEAGADLAYARVRAALERQGKLIGSNDLLIAAHALSLGATLVTDNVREFARVEGLAIENWLRD